MGPPTPRAAFPWTPHRHWAQPVCGCLCLGHSSLSQSAEARDITINSGAASVASATFSVSCFPIPIYMCVCIYIFIEGKGQKKKGRETWMCERYINWLPLMHPLLGTWPETQACALTGNRTGNSLVHRLTLSPLSHTSQGRFPIFYSPVSVVFQSAELQAPRDSIENLLGFVWVRQK